MTTGIVKKYREIRFLKDPEEIVEVGRNLLSSVGPWEVLSGLVLMTGLKCESLLSKHLLEYKTPYSIRLTQREDNQAHAREIPTLTLASEVIKAVQFIRNTVETEHLNNRSINAIFLPKLIKVCEAKFKTGESVIITNSITRS